MWLAGVCVSYTLVAQDTVSATTQSEMSDSPSQINAMLAKGKSFVYEYPDSALYFLRKAEVLADSLDFVEARGESKSWIGVSFYIKGEYDRALPYFMESLRIFTALGDHSGIAGAFNHVGLILTTQKRFQDAIAYHRRGVYHAELARDISRLSRNNFNIGLNYDELSAYDSALHYLTLSLAQSKSADIHQIVVMSYNRIAKMRFHRGQYDLAKTFYDSALNHPVGQTNWERAFAWSGLAEVYDALDEHARAIAAGLKGLSIATEINAKWEIVHSADILARAYANAGDYANAYRMVRKMEAYKDTVFNEEKENQLNYIHLKENELMTANLEKENALQAVRLEQKNFQIVVAGILSVSLAVIMLILYSRHRHKSRLNQQLLEVNAKIEEQNKDLNEMNEGKNQLFSIISHDLRTPFANLHGMLTLLRSDALSPAEQAELLDQVEQNFWSVSGTLDSLLQWAHNQMEGQQTNPEPLFADTVIEAAFTFWEPTMRRKGVQGDIAKGSEIVFADKHHLQTAIRNVVGNAIKFTRPGGSVFVSTVRRPGLVGIVIRDTGIGIPDDVQKNLFSLTKHKQRAGTAKEKGTGLGLIICQQLLEKNGGHIEVESEVGKGTTFTLWVPSADGAGQDRSDEPRLAERLR